MPDHLAPEVPEARRLDRQRTRLSLVWLVPLGAALVGAWVAATHILSRGPEIRIELHSGEGIEAGKTKIRYQGVEIGTVRDIALSDDHRRVVAVAEMDPKTEPLLVGGTKIWVVRPRISGTTISGIGTLISGAYIGLDPGPANAERKRDFVALASPPMVTGDTRGRFFVLRTPDLGSVDYGTPIYFRRLHVGEVVAYELDADGRAMTIRAFVREPYDTYVTTSSRFWHASGIDITLSASGVSVQTESLLSILIGGIAFDTGTDESPAPVADSETEFRLFPNRAQAHKPGAQYPQSYLLVFRQSVRGLEVGAPVEFRGIRVGEVTQIQPQFDSRSVDFTVPVTITVDPRMFGVTVVDQPADEATRRRLVEGLMARGLRAQLKSGNLLTGAQYVSFDFFPDAAPVGLDWSRQPVELAVVPGDLEGIEATIARIVKKLDAMPIQDIGEGVKRTLGELDRTLVSARGTLDSADALVQPDSGLSEQLGTTLQEVSRAARGLRLLADYLEQHPESLLRGKAAD